MGIQRKTGYSATVEGFLLVDGKRTRLAKTNGGELTLAEPVELTPGATGELIIIVDGRQNSKLVMLPDGVALGQTLVNYQVSAPF